MNLMKSALTTATGVYKYSCATTCSAGTLGGITTTCCYSGSNCNTIRTLSTSNKPTTFRRKLTSKSKFLKKHNVNL